MEYKDSSKLEWCEAVLVGCYCLVASATDTMPQLHPAPPLLLSVLHFGCIDNLPLA